MLKKCIDDPKSILPFEGLGAKDNLSFEEVLDQILDGQVKNLRNKEVVFIMVFWKNHLVEDATSKAEADMKSCYPHLLEN